ncbi:hypothetical protein Vadar_010706 [Vaccinium darrowii]|uniref:Uncharacterized protein n=1 Tax=Vaccinium darrowii TaxID=229202 RepID=A0ACB7XGM5_9ERIC|nr:hypothetical protein Vadar_010706 [Vaccinium darrowii]
MSSSQTGASKGKNASSVGMKAQWDQLSKEYFIHACVEELGGVAYKTGTVLTKVGWVNVVKKINERTGKQYDKVQLKNQWGVLKKDWQLWQNLVLSENGLGRDLDTSAIAASDDWWDLKLTFCDKPLSLEDEMHILFGSNTTTGEHKYTPSSRFLSAAPGVWIKPNVNLENIDAFLEDDDEIQ